MSKEKDIRTLCHSCYSDMFHAGYKLTKMHKPKSSCDKCRRQGSQYILHK